MDILAPPCIFGLMTKVNGISRSSYTDVQVPGCRAGDEDGWRCSVQAERCVTRSRTWLCDVMHTLFKRCPDVIHSVASHGTTARSTTAQYMNHRHKRKYTNNGSNSFDTTQHQGRRSVWDRGAHVPQYLDWGPGTLSRMSPSIFLE